MSRRTNEIKTKLERLIIDLKMEGRSQLPPERKLCEDFGVSRITAGKAIAQLVNEGILNRRQGSGTFITDSDAAPKDSVIGVLLRTAYFGNDPHFHTLIDALSEKTEGRRTSIQIIDRVLEQFRESENSNRIVKAIGTGLLNGLIIVSRMPSEIIVRLNRATPLVVLGNHAGSGDIACVYSDDAMAGFIGTKKLVDSGHRKILYMTENFELPDSQVRLTGCRIALKAAGLPEPSVLETGISEQTLKKRLIEIIKNEKFTAIYSRTTKLADYAIEIITGEGLRVPEDVSVVGTGVYDNSENGFSKITAVDLKWRLMAGTAYEMLFSMMAGKTIKRKNIMIEPELKEGKTVCKIK
ncbi:MAG: GntR family transcriptional regulator [Victivallales bacterium]|jgi:DNA-binding LacI/PurR family transcriptional regulator